VLIAAEVTRFLRERELVGPSEQLSLAPAIQSTGPNCTLLMREVDRSGLFIKQARDARGHARLAREAWFHQQVESSDSRMHGVRDHVAGFLAWDVELGVLVLSGFLNAVDLQHPVTGRIKYSAPIGRAIGTVLAALHELGPTSDVLNSDTAHEPRGRAWRALAGGEGEASLGQNECTAAFVDEVHRLDEIQANVDEIRSRWSPDALIHGDIRWDNWMLLPSTRERPELRLVDWETVCAGDPRWDVGSAIAAYVMSLVRSIPSARVVDVDTARRALKSIRPMRPGIKALCQSYIAERHLDASERDLIANCLPYVVTHLVMSAIDEVDAAGAPTAGAGALVQVACNLINDPGVAVELLLGPMR